MKAEHKVVNGMFSRSFARENWNNVFEKFLHVKYSVDEFSNTFDNPLLSAMHCALWATVLMAFQKPQDL